MPTDIGRGSDGKRKRPRERHDSDNPPTDADTTWGTQATGSTADLLSFRGPERRPCWKQDRWWAALARGGSSDDKGFGKNVINESTVW